MQAWKKIALVTLVLVVVFGVRFYFLWRERNEPVANPREREERALTSDDIVQPRKLYIDSLESARVLDGKRVWMQAGYELAYYPYVGKRVDFSRRAGLIPPTQAMDVSGFVLAKAPASTLRLIPLGAKQVFAVFTMPGDAKQYATAVGYVDGATSQFYCDTVFFYDDPHGMYKHWPAAVWKAVDAHRAETGMNELQVVMSLGMIQRSSDMVNFGNRTVMYDTDLKRWTVTFERDRAVRVGVVDLVAP